MKLHRCKDAARRSARAQVEPRSTQSRRCLCRRRSLGRNKPQPKQNKRAVFSSVYFSGRKNIAGRKSTTTRWYKYAEDSADLQSASGTRAGHQRETSGILDLNMAGLKHVLALIALVASARATPVPTPQCGGCGGCMDVPLVVPQVSCQSVCEPACAVPRAPAVCVSTARPLPLPLPLSCSSAQPWMYQQPQSCAVPSCGAISSCGVPAYGALSSYSIPSGLWGGAPSCGMSPGLWGASSCGMPSGLWGAPSCGIPSGVWGAPSCGIPSGLWGAPSCGVPSGLWGAAPSCGGSCGIPSYAIPSGISSVGSPCGQTCTTVCS